MKSSYSIGPKGFSSCLWVTVVFTGRRGRLLYPGTRDPAAQNEEAEPSGRQRSGLHELPLRCVMIKVPNTRNYKIVLHCIFMYFIYIIYVFSFLSWPAHVGRSRLRTADWTREERHHLKVTVSQRGRPRNEHLKRVGVLFWPSGSPCRPSTSAW